MDQTILQNVSVKERVQMLKDSCLKQESFTYPRQLTDEELDLEKHSYSQNAISIELANRKLQDAKEVHKGETKPVKQEMSTQISRIRTGIEEVTGNVFLLDDQESGSVGYYNENGELVYQRLLMQDERQLRLVPEINTNTGT